jgi:hypothetical protein
MKKSEWPLARQSRVSRDILTNFVGKFGENLLKLYILYIICIAIQPGV